MTTSRTPHPQYQSYLLLGLALFFVGHFLLLSPSSLEDDFGGMRVIEPKDLLSFLKNEPQSLVPDLPNGVIPAYSFRESEYFSSDGVKPSMKMNARKSNLYQKEQVMHSREVVVETADHTKISSKEAIFYILKNQVNFYGSVHTVLANGAEIDSEFATIFTKPVTEIFIPINQQVEGRKVDGVRSTHFKSFGLTYRDAPVKELHLISQVNVKIIDEKVTDVISDQATYTYEQGQLYFFMNETRPLAQQFVKVQQADLELKSRKLEISSDPKRNLDQITALRDVWIKDSHDPKRISISSSGKAIYDQKKNDVLLTDFPQVYQEGDTITGDIITFHRNTDLIEVKQSNAIYNNDSPSSSP